MSTEKDKKLPEVIVQQPQLPQTFNFFDPVQFETMQRVCNLFASSEIVPDMYRAKDKDSQSRAIANCMVAIEMAQRIGASPLMVMQNLVIIYGRPSWSSKFLIATVNSCGRFNPLQFRFTEKGMLGKVDYITYKKEWQNPAYPGGKGYYKNTPETKTFDGTKMMDIECVAYTTAKGSDKVLESSPVSLRMAIQEGWWTKDGSKWPTMYRQMLMYRAGTFWTNTYAPELSMGLKTDDEVRDIVDVDYEEIADKVHSTIQQANAGKTMSFDAAEPAESAKPAEPAKPAKKEEKAEPKKEVKQETKDEAPKQQPPTAQPTQTQQARGGQARMPGF